MTKILLPGELPKQDVQLFTLQWWGPEALVTSPARPPGNKLVITDVRLEAGIPHCWQQSHPGHLGVLLVQYPAHEDAHCQVVGQV